MSLSALALGCYLLSGCGGTTTGNPAIDTSASELAESSLSGAANATEPNGTHASYHAFSPKSLYAQLGGFLTPVSACYAATACPLLTNSSCSGTSIIMPYSTCKFGASSTVWDGSQTVAFSSSCSSTTLSSLANQTLTRTFGSGTTETTAAGVITTIDTANAATSGWDSHVTVAGGGESTAFGSCTDSADCNRTVTIGGIHLRASFRGKIAYDHTISSGAITVSGAGAHRSISTGTITVQHNLAKYTAKAQITTPLTYARAECCHPVSGTVTSTLTGSLNGTETLTFTGATTDTCGSATLINTDGITSDLRLDHCF